MPGHRPDDHRYHPLIVTNARQIFRKLARPVARAVDRVVDRIVGLVRKLRPKAKKPKGRRDERGRKDVDRVLDAALSDARALVLARKPVHEIESRLPAIRRELTKLVMVPDRVQGRHQIIHFVAAITPEKRGPEEGAVLSKESVQEDYGILIKNQEKFRHYADQRNVVIEVRPTNKDSVPHLLRGAYYKPEAVKAKTINDADVLLRVAARKKGLVGFFVRKPPKPNREELGAEEYAVAIDRYHMRDEERGKYGETMERLGRQNVGPGRFEVEAHVVYGYNEKLERRPIAGDHDMYDIRRPDGSRLSTPEYLALVGDMRNAEFGVMHGAVAYWQPTDPDERRMRDKLVDQHKRQGNEGLVRFAPGQPPRYVVAETPL